MGIQNKLNEHFRQNRLSNRQTHAAQRQDMQSNTQLNPGHSSQHIMLKVPVIKPARSRAGPKGLRAESARAFTVQKNPTVGRGILQQDFFTETAVTPERKVEKIVPKVGN